MSRPAGGVQPSVRPAPEARDDPGSANGGHPTGAAPHGGRETDGGAPPDSGHPSNGSRPAGGPSAAVPPRPRSPSPGPAPSPGPTPVPEAPVPDAPAQDAPAPDPTRSGPGRATRRARGESDTGGGSTWLRDEIRRRVADGAGGSGGSGRHARVEPAAEGPAVPDATAPPDETARTAPPAPAGPAPDDGRDDEPAPRPRPARPRPRSDLVPDPYAPGGMRPGGSGGWPAAGPPDGAKQWPPATGSSATLPRRTPGATPWPSPSPKPSWELDRDALIAGPDAASTAAPDAPAGASDVEAPPETRPVPTRWTATGRRAPAVPDPAPPAPIPGPTARAFPRPDPAGPAEPGRLDDLDEDDLDDLDEDDLDDLDPQAALRGPAAERTEVIWRAPDLDDSPVAPAPATDPVAEPGPAPYTGARPRRFAAAPTDAPAPDAAEPAAAEDPGGGRVRIVLSERRSTAHSSRGLSDVQDPGPVGTLLRNTLVRNQLALALRVCVVAVVGLGLPPALFVAFPVLGEVSVLGIRLPWLLLGGLAYPFLLGLGWWYVTSAEAVEQEFAEDVTDR